MWIVGQTPELDFSYLANFGLAAVILGFIGLFLWKVTWAVGSFLAPHVSRCLEGLATWFTKQGELADCIKAKWDEEASFRAGASGALHHLAEAGKHATECKDVRHHLDLAQQELLG